MIAVEGDPQAPCHPLAEGTPRVDRPRFRTLAVLLLAVNSQCRPPSPPAPHTYIPATPDANLPDRALNQWVEAAPSSPQSSAGSAVVRHSVAVDGPAIALFVRKFCDGLAAANLKRLHDLIEPTAVVVDARGRERPFEAAWANRLEKFDYRKLDERRVCRLGDPVVVNVAIESSDLVPPRLRNTTDTLFVRVLIDSRPIGGQSLFGSTLWLRLHESPEGLRATGYSEDFEFD